VAPPLVASLGVVLFDAVPDAWSRTGIALIMGAGLFMMARAAQLSRRGRG
jgi:drug/metabolite transporter (DMT)-like permease